MDELNKLLERAGLKYEDLTSAEKETYNNWMDAFKQKKVTVSTIKENIATMRESVENELTTTTHNSKQDLFLKARLRNYLLLEAFLQSPEKAEKALERAISGMIRKV